MKRSILFTILLLHLVWSTDGYGTSIVAIRSPEAVAIAADSRLTVKYGTGHEITGNECKIFQSGRIFFSCSGFYKDPARSFDVISIASNLLRLGGPFGTLSDKAAAAIVNGLQTELLKIKSDDPALYEKYFGDKTATVLKILFAAFEDGTPNVAVYDIRRVVTHSGEVSFGYERKSCPGDCNINDTVAYFMTDMRPILEYLKNEKLTIMSPEEMARFLVEMVIRAHTPNTGPPIDVLRIDKNGAQWIEHKMECPEISND